MYRSVSVGFGQINGVCSPASTCPTSSTGRVRPDPPRRSRSQGTRKLHKCLSTASYSEDCGSHVPCLTAPTVQRQQLLVARQYCSFGSTVTRLMLHTRSTHIRSSSFHLIFTTYAPHLHHQNQCHFINHFLIIIISSVYRMIKNLCTKISSSCSTSKNTVLEDRYT